MIDFGIPAAFFLFLLGVGLLFIQRPPKGKRDWPSFLAMTLALFALLLFVWLRQYSKFTHGTGIFYFMSPKYGATILTALEAVVFLAGVRAAWKDLSE